jgi:hypothetical protein
MEARRKLTQTNKTLLNALDLSGSPVTPQMTPKTRNRTRAGYRNHSNQKSILTVSSLVKTPQSKQFMSMQNSQHKPMSFLDLVSPDNHPGQMMRKLPTFHPHLHTMVPNFSLELPDFSMQRKKLQQ